MSKDYKNNENAANSEDKNVFEFRLLEALRRLSDANQLALQTPDEPPSVDGTLVEHETQTKCQI